MMFKWIAAISILFVSCVENSDSVTYSLPINATELHVKRGDCFAFKDSTNKYFIGVLYDFFKSKEGIWYDICFANYHDSIYPSSDTISKLKFCGRRIANGVTNNYDIGFDIIFYRDSALNNNRNKITFIENIDLNDLKSDIGGEGSAFTYSDLVNDFYYSKKIRALTPDDYRNILKANFHAEEYISFSEALAHQKK